MDALIAEQEALHVENEPELAVLLGEFPGLKDTLSTGPRQRASSQPVPAKTARHAFQQGAKTARIPERWLSYGSRS